jgi:hypothetical protein
MATAVSKITLSPSRDIPFNKLILSQANVRHVKAGVSIEELADDIAQRTLLHSLSVRAVVDADGQETGMFEIPAGGRRFRALELLVKQKRLAKTALVPCVVRDSGFAEEDSLAENIQRVPLLGYVAELSFERIARRCCHTGLVQVANRRDPRATRRALTSEEAARVGGSCLPTWASPGRGSGGGGRRLRQTRLPIISGDQNRPVWLIASLLGA